jgi:hypothetical protein
VVPATVSGPTTRTSSRCRLQPGDRVALAQHHRPTTKRAGGERLAFVVMLSCYKKFTTRTGSNLHSHSPQRHAVIPLRSRRRCAASQAKVRATAHQRGARRVVHAGRPASARCAAWCAAGVRVHSSSRLASRRRRRRTAPECAGRSVNRPGFGAASFLEEDADYVQALPARAVCLSPCSTITGDHQRRRHRAPRPALQLSAHQSGSLITTESFGRWPAGLWPAGMVRRVGVEPTTRWLGVA